MSDVPPQLLAALREQLRHREAALRSGARHIGWKLGMGRRERIGSRIAVGHLTTATLIADDGQYRASGDGVLHADAELSVELAADLEGVADGDAVRPAIGACGPALEIVDLAVRDGEPESLVADNVFHRAVAFVPQRLPLVSSAEVTAYVNGALRARAPWPHDIPERIASAVSILEALGQRLRTGDRIITGAIVQVPIAPGDHVEADFGGYGRITVEVQAEAREPG